jgi:inorganic phosphate transporter, PiT family
MDLTVLFFLTSGLFLGWSLGANHLGNVFGTAVGTRMVSFYTAAFICSVFVILGAVISGTGPTQTLGKLGAVNALAGSFMTALAAGLTVYGMTRLGLPVSTTQAIVGGIVGWNFFSETVTNTDALTKIVVSWVAGPVLAAVLAMGLFRLVKYVFLKSRLHLLTVDAYTRIGLILAGAFGAYSLGANNIANVMGVFVHATPFNDVTFLGRFQLSATQQLFLLGAIAIAVGVYTYSRKVVHTVGAELLRMSPAAAWVVVMSHSIVLLVFASQNLERLLVNLGLPSIPLVPVSSSEVAVGAVLGIALMQGGAGLRWRVLMRIGVGWVLTPIITGIVCFVGLFFLQNVFQQQVHRDVRYVVSTPVLEKFAEIGIPSEGITDLAGRTFPSGKRFVEALAMNTDLDEQTLQRALYYAESGRFVIAPGKLARLKEGWFDPNQLDALRRISGITFTYKWRLAEALAGESAAWRLLPETRENKYYNDAIREKLALVYRVFSDQ